MSIDICRPEQYIALVTINNPARRNALGPADFHGLANAWRQLGRDPSVRCIVITGEGSQAFCSGAQLDADFSAEHEVDDLVDAALLKTSVLGKPLVAAVNGHCVAGGFELMMACDLRVVSDQALLGLPEVRWAIVPSGGGAMKLIEQIGHARAMQLMLTAELVSAATALDFGLVNSVVPAGDVLQSAMILARRIAANSPLAVYMTKQSALAGRSRGWQALEADERARVRIVRESVDVQIGRRAFLDKTVPDYPAF